MSKTIGRLVKLGVAKESSRGGGGTPAIWLSQTGLTVKPMVDEVRVEGALGSLADSEDKLIAEKYAEGDISAELRDKSFGYFLYALLGGCSSTSYLSAYKHTFTLSETNQHQSLALTIQDGVDTNMYKLAMLNSLEISAELGGLVNFTAGFMSKSPVGSSATYARTAENKFTKKHVKVYIADTVGNLGSATALDIKSLTLTVNKNTERDSALGTVQPVDILNKQISIEGSLNLVFEDNTYRDYMLDGDTKALRIAIINNDVTIGSTNPALTIDLAKVDFSGWDIDRSLNEIVKQSINFKANYDLTNGLVYACTLVNEQASY